VEDLQSGTAIKRPEIHAESGGREGDGQRPSYLQENTMRHLVVLALLAATTARADLLLTIEAKTTMTGTVPAHIPEVVRNSESIVIFKVKGNKISVRAAPVNPKMPVDVTMINDLDSGTMTQIDHAQKIYWLATREKQEQLAAMILKAQERLLGAPPKQRPEPKATGKKAELNGYAVEEYVADTPKARYTYWVAPATQQYVAVLATKLAYVAGAIGVVASMWDPDVAKLPGIPIRTIIELRQEGYVHLIVTTVQSVRDVSLAPEDFAIPAGYKELKFPSPPGLK
jgi:hypothetical protein